MGRKKKSSRIMYFDWKGFMHDLGKELKEVTKLLRDELYQMIKDEVSSLPFKDNEVKLADGSKTSDKERRTALLQSIVYENLEWLNNDLYGGVLRTAVTAMETNFRESHIGIYYEYGTGEKVSRVELLSGLNSYGNYNPFRVPMAGARIVTRSKFVQGGKWTDLGGNERITRSPRGGEYDEGFRKYIGEDIEAYHWFLNSFNKIREKAFNEYKKAIRKVNFLDYFYLRPRYTLGRD